MLAIRAIAAVKQHTVFIDSVSGHNAVQLKQISIMHIDRSRRLPLALGKKMQNEPRFHLGQSDGAGSLLIAILTQHRQRMGVGWSGAADSRRIDHGATPYVRKPESPGALESTATLGRNSSCVKHLEG